MSNEKYQGKYNNGTYPPVRRTRRRRKNNTQKIVLLAVLVLLLIVSAVVAWFIKDMNAANNDTAIHSGDVTLPGSVAADTPTGEAPAEDAAGPVVTSNPQSLIVDEGETVIFAVEATGEGLTYQWQWRKNDSAKWAATTVEGNKTSSIKVPATAERNGYQYRCKITDANGKTANSKGATLTVNSDLSITGQPKSKSASVGDTVTFKVTATGNGLKYQWQWRKNDSAKWASTTVDGNKTASIKVPVTKDRNGYQYRCVITDSNGNKLTSKAVTLTVK